MNGDGVAKHDAILLLVMRVLMMFNTVGLNNDRHICKNDIANCSDEL